MNSAPLTDTSHSPHATLHGVGLAESRWTDGFWAERFAVTRDSLIPAMSRHMTETHRVKFLGNFLVAARLAEGSHRGPRWNDGDFYKWLESVAALYAVTRDPNLDEQMDAFIELIGKVQRDDGYIHTPLLIDHLNGGHAQPFADPMHFEMYNMGHLITAAVVHHRATGKKNLLALALKSADFLAKQFANPTPALARNGICPAHLMALVELYRTTHDRKHLDLAVHLLNMRDLVEKGDDDNQDRIPFRQQRQAVGHGVRSTYLYASAADIYAETGEPALLEALDPIWHDLVSRKLYITAGIGALHDGASPDAAIDQSQITRVHQAFGRPYQLPHNTAHNETCAAIGNLLWNWRMLLITGESRFADVVEHTLFNSVLAGVSLDGTQFFYTNTLRRLDPQPVELRWPQTRTDDLGCYCCPPNVARTLAESPTYAYAKSKDGLLVILYGSSELQTTLADGTPLRVTQQTNYPWDGEINLTLHLDSPKQFPLSLRIPEWATGATLTINGQSQDAKLVPGIFHEIRRTWRQGDRITLNLPMPAHLIQANPYVEEAVNQLAVARGPLVYCLESADLPPDVNAADVRLDATINPAISQPASGPLGNLIPLEANARTIEHRDWQDQLYRPFTPAPSKKIRLRLIPYYAWDNRGPGEMTVWLPFTRQETSA